MPSTRRRHTVVVDSQLLVDERSKRGLKQAAMAKYLKIGLSTYQKAEAGKPIDAAVASAIAQQLGFARAQFIPGAPAPGQSDPTIYLKDLHGECSFIDVRGLLVGSGKAPRLPIEQVYIPLTATGGGQSITGDPSSRGEARAVTLEDTLENRKLVVVGDPGSGKSTFLRRLAYDQSGPGGKQFPVLVRIGQLEDFIHKCVHGGVIPDAPAPDSADWLPRFLEDRAKEFNWTLDAAFFRGKFRERSTIILLDGLDEVPNAARREAMTRLFENAAKAYRDARFVVTTRPASYEGKATLDDFHEVRIGNLDGKAKAEFLAHWSGFLYSGDSERARRHLNELLDALRARPDIRNMASNPLMLTAVAVIYWNDKKLPDHRADLYESILKWLSEAKNYPHRLQGQTCLTIYGALALGMQCYPGGRIKQIEKDEGAEFIKHRFRDLPDAERKAAALDFLEHEFVDSGIVVSRGSRLEFWHLTFQEYLAARSCADLDPATFLFEGDRWLQQEWREVMLLVPGVLIRNGEMRIDAVFSAALNRADSPSATLVTKARAAGLLGTILRDLRISKYSPPEKARFDALLAETSGIFDKDRAAGVELQVRVEAAEALGQAGDARLDKDRNNWVTIPGGVFFMGAQKKSKTKPGYDPEAADYEGPVRELSVESFKMGRYPVTVQEFAGFVADEEFGYSKEFHWSDGGYSGEPAPEGWDEQILHPNRPVVNVSWFGAAAYCKWAGLRLPTEAEWEFAARGKQGRKYPWGNEPPDNNHANYDDAHVGAATPVGLFPNGATPEGIDDMAGNVWEWTADWYNNKKQERVVRGGCWVDYSRYLRATVRGRVGPEFRDLSIGFRCVREA